MFDNSIQRIGFCCKYMDPDQTQKPKILKEIQQNYTERMTTITWLNRQEKSVAEERMLELVTHNMQAAYNLVEWVSNLPAERRMVRLGSNQLPGATQEDWAYMWQDPTNIKMLEEGFAKVGELARKKDVRLSFHPGQFTVLASDKDDVVKRIQARVNKELLTKIKKDEEEAKQIEMKRREKEIKRLLSNRKIG